MYPGIMSKSGFDVNPGGRDCSIDVLILQITDFSNL